MCTHMVVTEGKVVIFPGCELLLLLWFPVFNQATLDSAHETATPYSLLRAPQGLLRPTNTHARPVRAPKPPQRLVHVAAGGYDAPEDTEGPSKLNEPKPSPAGDAPNTSAGSAAADPAGYKGRSASADAGGGPGGAEDASREPAQRTEHAPQPAAPDSAAGDPAGDKGRTASADAGAGPGGAEDASREPA